MSKWEELKNQVTESPVWQSIFRHGYDDTPRNRVLMVSQRRFLHLHPSKVRRHADAHQLHLVHGRHHVPHVPRDDVTGVLMFYRPTAE
jgi:hypothetical protein